MGARSRIFGCWLSTVAAGCGGGGNTPAPAPSDSTTVPIDTSLTDTTPIQPATSQPSTSAPSPNSSTPLETSTPDPSTTADSSSLGSATSSDESSDSGYVDEGLREWLSQTGLYAEMATETLGPRVKEFKPQFELWTDGAEKRRWVHIPEGAVIDTSYTDEWQFPVGTKLWKEFSRDGVRIETRLIEKLPPERAQEGFQGWLYMTYVWNEDQTDAVATIDGVENAKGTEHDVPSQEACGDCHDMRREKPLGFSAVQLSHNDSDVSTDSLFADGWISAKPDVPLVVPGTEDEKQLLGYFHANCGHCHRDGAPVNNRVGTLQLWLESSKLASVQETNAYLALVGANTESGQGSVLSHRIVPGDPENSEVMRRLLFRAEGDIAAPPVDDSGEQIEVPMPPLGTEIIDEPAVERVREWILSLPATE